jgi:hypothetical protein
MKVVAAFVVLLALGAAAQGKPVPVAAQAIAVSFNDSADDSAINIGAAGATLESNYFRVPQPPIAAGRIFPCRLQLRVFEKTRLAQSCN